MRILVHCRQYVGLFRYAFKVKMRSSPKINEPRYMVHFWVWFIGSSPGHKFFSLVRRASTFQTDNFSDKTIKNTESTYQFEFFILKVGDPISQSKREYQLFTPGVDF